MNKDHDVTNFMRDWQSALDECAYWGAECEVRRTAAGNFIVLYRGDPNNLYAGE